jgi:hypothetical protein
MDDELATIEAQIRALLPRSWRLEPFDVLADGLEPEWGDLDAATVAQIRAEMVLARFGYAWAPDETGGGGWATGPTRMQAAQRTLARLREDVAWVGGQGAFHAHIEAVRLSLMGVPVDVASIDIAPDGRWAATTRGEPALLMTRDGPQVPVAGYWVHAAWMGDLLVTLERDEWRSQVVVRDRGGSEVARWSCPWGFVVGRDWIAAADSGDDPNDDILRRVIVWNADGSVRREWQPSATWEDAEVFALPGGGLGLLANTWSEVGWAMVLFETVDGPPRRVSVPRLWDDMSLSGPPPTALGDDTFALLRRDSIWAWRGGDRAMTLIHEGPFMLDGHDVLGADAEVRWLPDGRMIVRAVGEWWELRVVPGSAPRG